MDPAPEMEINSISFSSYLRLLRQNRNFRRLWTAQIVSEIGDWFYTLAIYSLLLQLTGRAGSVALALVLQVLPQTFIGPLSGVVNDRIRRKHVMIAGIDADNTASIRMHERLGFFRVAHFQQVGFKFDRWLDLVFLQRDLDQR